MLFRWRPSLKALGFDRLRLIVTMGSARGHGVISGGKVPARIWRASGSLCRLIACCLERLRVFIRMYGKAHISTWIAGFVVGIPAGILDIGTLGDLTNIGTLFAFVVVSVGVIILRRKQPERPRGFVVPWVPAAARSCRMICCLVLMLSLPLETWIRFVVWLAIGLGDYFIAASGSKRIDFLGALTLRVRS